MEKKLIHNIWRNCVCNLLETCKIAAESLVSTYHGYAAAVDAVCMIDNRIVQNRSVQVAQVPVGDVPAYRAYAAIVVITIVLAQFARALALVLAASGHAAGDLDV